MEWTQERIKALLLKVEESQRLDYKNGLFLKNNCQDALTKQITGFANSDGGTLIIGVAEGQGAQKHLAIGFAPCDGIEWSKERVEALIDANISPRIPGITVHPIRIDGDIQRSVYVIDIPKSDTCHQASDARYYFRLNFSTEPMKDFQVRDVMNRAKSTRLELSFRLDRLEYIDIGIQNKGKSICRNWSLTVIIPRGAIEFRSNVNGDPIINPSFAYKGILQANIEFGEISNPAKALFSSQDHHIFQEDRLRLDRAEAIFPITRLSIISLRAKYIDKSQLAVYWQIDSDDGRRTYGLITPTQSESYEYIGGSTDDLAYVER